MQTWFNMCLSILHEMDNMFLTYKRETRDTFTIVDIVIYRLLTVHNSNGNYNGTNNNRN